LLFDFKIGVIKLTNMKNQPLSIKTAIQISKSANEANDEAGIK
jgi:hypothetical protein